MIGTDQMGEQFVAMLTRLPAATGAVLLGVGRLRVACDGDGVRS